MESKPYSFGNMIQFLIRMLIVSLSVYINARWYRMNYPKSKHAFLIILIPLFLSLYLGETGIST